MKFTFKIQPYQTEMNEITKRKSEQLTDDIETKLDEADYAAAISEVRSTHEEVFAKLKKSPMDKKL